MAVNSKILTWLEDNFPTKKSVDDYIEEVNLAYKKMKDYLVRPITYSLFIKQGTYIQQYVEKESHYWYLDEMPALESVILPDAEDPLWVLCRKEAASYLAPMTPSGYSSKATDVQIIAFLKKNFYKDLSSKADLNQKDGAANVAWTNYYNNDKDGTDRAPSMGNGLSLFGNYISLSVFVKYAIIRLRQWDPVTKTLSGETITSPNPGANNPPTKNTDTTVNPIFDSDENYLVRIAFLEDFVNNLSSDLYNTTDGAIGGLYATIARKNNIFIQADQVLSGLSGYDVFEKILAPRDGAALTALDSKYQKLLFQKMEVSGLLDLLVHSDEIRQFGRDRFRNEDTVKASAKNLVNGTRDTAWLQQLGVTLSVLSREPVVMASLYTYFPDLINFFFEALAIAGDYSNNGAGGGSEDANNDPEAILRDLVASFGQVNGESIFTGAWELVNTAQRVRKALAESPFRQNIAPKSPDIFHLRLGAANFYVPPIKIDVGTTFKISSLGEQGLRQRTSAKYNAGYKHVQISMKLYFPNYEEIWGISIKDASKINLKDNYKIDFKQAGNEDEIDKFLSSLRGMVAAFKYSPIIPIKNHYLNSVHGITGVALNDMIIETIENYPFGLAVTLQMSNFNHKPFLPMINDFNQSIDWGRYRQYMGKAAGQLHNYVNEEFLLQKPSSTTTSTTPPEGDYTNPSSTGAGLPTTLAIQNAIDAISPADPNAIGYNSQDVFVTNVYKEWTDGSNISFFVPAETQTKIFTPDISDFRSNAEKLDAQINSTSRGIWDSFLNTYGISVNNDVGYYKSLDDTVITSKGNQVEFTIRKKLVESIDILTTASNPRIFTEKAYSTSIESFIAQNSDLLNSARKIFLRNFSNDSNAFVDVATWKFGVKTFTNITLLEMKKIIKALSINTNAYLDHLVEQQALVVAINANKSGNVKFLADTKSQLKEKYAIGYTALMYQRFFTYGPIRDLMEAARERAGSFHIREWEVPMLELNFDPKSVIVTGVAVSLSNNFVPLQLQLQEEPTFQHIGGGDSSISIRMIVKGEKELVKLRKMFDHINGLARLEHATGVMGFLGIKNIITALAGIKYVLPLRFDVQTVEGFPHVYAVNLQLVDFDIFQQKREQLSSAQQKQFIEEFGTKKNPFLRIKQLWGQFNAYPDFPLEIRNKANEIVGTLDPDFYFRSFDMFDRDVVNNITTEAGKLTRLNFTNVKPDTSIVTDLPNTSMRALEEQSKINQTKLAQYEAIIAKFKEYIKVNNLTGLKKYVKDTLTLSSSEVASYIRDALENNDTNNFLLKYVDSLDEKDFPSSGPANGNYRVAQGKLQVGDISSGDAEDAKKLRSLLKGEKSIGDEDSVSFEPDDLPAHCLIHTFPAVAGSFDRKMPSILHTADGYQFGYVNKDNGRFYLTVDDINVRKESGEVTYFGVTDTQSPDVGTTKSLTGVAGTKALSDYQYAYTSGDNSQSEATNKNGNSKSVSKHWEKMMIDTSYRDISGRMIRAYPTYMLWLIDEGNFAGTKLFDNFYGLQSITSFSIVQSEDLLGDTLMLNISNMYSKLSTREATTIFNGTNKQNDDPGTSMGLTSGLESIIDLTLNRARNMLGHMESQYVVSIENIRLKPGVRVHLRGGYGSNPNSLQTLFNGVITEVELGQLVKVTAQSDAIELSPIINSTNNKGSSGKIDGGINTGMYMSEPRDLMVRLLSMGASRTREAFAMATRGTIFSGNKFGIKHFGNILYEPLNEIELNRQKGIRNALADAQTAIGRGAGIKGSVTATFGMINPADQNQSVLGAEARLPVLSMMQTLWSNFSSQRDLELFKRNIYPGNGTGIAQYLGGDLGDGWAQVSSLSPESNVNPRLDYLNRLTDSSWNNLLQSSGAGDASAEKQLKLLTASGQAREGGMVASKILGGGLAAVGIAGMATLPGTILPAIAAGGTFTGLLGALGGRGGKNIFKTMGLISDLDDDMPGFDEVSFRCQTYMKSVWDIFQTCARILPNYIVAVRPFEDRSTVFYGKPHWLYTSGVVPITTGFPSEEKAVRLGLQTPSYISPDQQLLETLAEINNQSSSTADYLQTSALMESSEALKGLIKEQSSNDSVYKPALALKGQIINLTDPKRLKFVSKETKEVLAEIPVKKGFVTIGYHLPIVPSGDQSQASLEEFGTVHKQIDQLPTRFSFPYFTDRTKGAILLDYAFFAVAEKRSKVNIKDTASEDFYNDDKDYQKLGRDKNWNIILQAEAQLIGKSPTTDYSDLIETEILKQEINLNISTLSSMRSLDVNTITGNAFIYDLEGLDKGSTGISDIVRMPLPSLKTEVSNANNIDSYGSWEYNYFSKGTITDQSPFSYKDWGSPKTAIEEQFYIAMRWPYKIMDDMSQSNDLLNKFKSEYFSGRSDSDFHGKPEDYKDRRILVYSPVTNQAVVCQPAFFMWGQDKVDIYQGNENDNRTDEWYLNAKGDFDEEATLAAIVSPDAALYLGVLNLTKDEKDYYDDDNDANDAAKTLASAGLSPNPQPRDCYFVFVDDNTPLGVATTLDIPIMPFKLGSNPGDTTTITGDEVLIGFGKYSVSASSEVTTLTATIDTYSSTGGMSQLPSGSTQEAVDRYMKAGKAVIDSAFTSYSPSAGTIELTSAMLAEQAARGGNYKEYFNYVNQKNYDKLSHDELYKILDGELKTTGLDFTGTGRDTFPAVYDPADPQAYDARTLFDEDFSSNVHVLAGNGRTLFEANEIWDQFRMGYHTYESVKEIFFNIYGINPEDEEALPPSFAEIIKQAANGKVEDALKVDIFKKFNETNASAVDEFSVILGSDFVNGKLALGPTDVKAAIEYARANFIDAPESKDGLISYFNSILKDKFIKLGAFVAANKTLIQASGTDAGLIFSSEGEAITGKQLFYLIIGLFRQAMWQEPYARAWLVLKPNRRYRTKDHWDFRPVDKIFAAFIDPNLNFASDKNKFLKLLADNKSEGNSSTNIISSIGGDVNDFYKNNIGPIWGALTEGLSGLLNMFRVSMMQMGYGLQEIDNFAKQANVLNKALNDSIYYSAGRAGSILRAVDNPFTREYGEPVIEVREPFQRMHYLSSFSHILANNITETTANVATQVTAVSDGKYPVTVALDKSIPSERQVEKTVETGLYFDNVMGSGIFGIAQPLFHPFEFARGMTKLATGAPDELTARRVALSHLKESLKDIYGGELIVLGSPDIRPHDLVYLADVYERMYGIFEVEQVVHHFTSDMGFVTSITPNAFVSVNDPGRWFLSSWMHSWFSIQNIRNDTRSIMSSVQAGTTGVISNGNISMDGLSQALQAQMLGGIQFTHGSSALMKDIVSNYSAEALSDAQASIETQMRDGNISGPGLKPLLGVAVGILGVGAIGALLAPTGFTALAAGLAGSVGGQMGWGGWKWVRDNVLDQHGCYIQYLNRNGQPMDGGLAINQGMVVGRHHSTKLLPGILGVRTKTRDVNGNAFIRSDDILKSLGWKETEITDLVRQVSLENALVNAEVLKYSGTSPDQASFSSFFKVVCKLVRVIDAGEIEVVDVFNPTSAPFKVKIDGIISVPMNAISGYTNNSTNQTTIINTGSVGGKAGLFISERLKDTVFVVRISPNDTSKTSIYTEDDLSPGAAPNKVSNYLKATGQNGYTDYDKDKAKGTIFYRLSENELSSIENDLKSIFNFNQSSGVETIKNAFKETLYKDSVLFKKFEEVYSDIVTSGYRDYTSLLGTSKLSEMIVEKKNLFSILYTYRVMEILYDKASQWPYVSWDEYYEDGGPATLNWELVVNNYAQVNTRDLLRERSSVISLDEQIAMPKLVVERKGN